jgi:hypothetical protein
MKAFALVLLAAAASAQKVLYDATAYYSEEIPKDGTSQYYIDIGAQDAYAAGNNYIIKFTADATYDALKQRTMNLWVSNDSSIDTTLTPRFTFDSSDDTCYVEPMNTTKGIGASCQPNLTCRVYFTLYASCLKDSCIKSLTTDVYARLMTSSKVYVRDITAGSAHVQIVENYTTSPFDVGKNELQYFNFFSMTSGSLGVHVGTSSMDDIAIYASETYMLPNSSALTWTQTKTNDNKPFTYGQWYLSVGGSNPVMSTATYHLCIGAACSPASVSIPLTGAVLLLITAFLSLF